MKTIAGSLLMLALILQTLWNPPAAMATTIDLLVVPSRLHITESFRGSPVTVSVEMPETASAVVEVTGGVHENRFLRKGRRGGLWMSVGEVKVTGAPSLYFVMSTPDLGSTALTGTRWGYKVVENRVNFLGTVGPKDVPVLFHEFVKLKESEGLYGIFPKSLKVVDTSHNQKTVQGQFMLPSNVAPGKYRVSVSVLNGGDVLDQRSVELTVRMKGLAAFLTALAHHHATLYGLLAVAIALATGFVTGFVFKGKGTH